MSNNLKLPPVGERLKIIFLNNKFKDFRAKIVQSLTGYDYNYIYNNMEILNKVQILKTKNVLCPILIKIKNELIEIVLD